MDTLAKGADKDGLHSGHVNVLHGAHAAVDELLGDMLSQEPPPAVAQEI